MFASSKTGSMMAGVGIGMALGAAAGMAGSKMMTKSVPPQRRQMHENRGGYDRRSFFNDEVSER